MKSYKFDAYSSTREAMSITQLNEYIKLLMDSSVPLTDVYLRGEISNFTHHRTGHFYFTLKDASSSISAVMFRSDAAYVRFAPQNGMKVLVSGRVSVFVRDGKYQIYVTSMEPDGIGSLYLAYEQLKAKLAAEHLFDEDHKRPLPLLPRRVGVVTSPTGAAIRDILNISRRRCPMAEVVIFPALVQGDGAPEQLIAGIDYFNATESVDVIIIGRGGGSLEDLWAFNNEMLARTVYASTIPVVSAVGHEIDFTICDFVADQRAPTPSAAAELVFPEISDLAYRVQSLEKHVQTAMLHTLSESRARIKAAADSAAMRTPKRLIDDKRMTMIAASDKLDRAMREQLTQMRARFALETGKLQALSPLAVLSRGYSAVFKEKDELVKSVGDIKKEDSIQIRVSDGVIHAAVTGVSKNRKKRTVSHGKEA
ncbi:MAG: exodeoxyribonuclease VII large subunit [Clostridia bacterium]|nr:exodeoxyribonuclease VII large subunit [Clostridia bacterium]